MTIPRAPWVYCNIGWIRFPMWDNPANVVGETCEMGQLLDASGWVISEWVQVSPPTRPTPYMKCTLIPTGRKPKWCLELST